MQETSNSSQSASAGLSVVDIAHVLQTNYAFISGNCIYLSDFIIVAWGQGRQHPSKFSTWKNFSTKIFFQKSSKFGA